MKKPDIELTDREIELLSQIAFGSNRHDEIHSSLSPMAELVDLLREREAIPEVRVLYFTDPERNPGGRGKSMQQIFENNGTSGAEIYRHGNFLKYLEYFVYGPKLPAVVIDKFKEMMAFSGYLTASDINDLTPYARKIVRSARLQPHNAAEEFFKLALECGAAPYSAESLLRSVRAIR